MVARGRADIALVTRSYLSDFMVRNAEMAGQLMVSERARSGVHHYALLRPKAPIRAGVCRTAQNVYAITARC